MKVLAVFISVIATLISAGWLYFDPGWEPALALVLSLSPAAWAHHMKKKEKGRGKGGNAIVAGEGSDVSVENKGIISSGKGGKGGSGGDAIHVGPGVKIKIINRGTISGGDAGT